MGSSCNDVTTNRHYKLSVKTEEGQLTSEKYLQIEGNNVGPQPLINIRGEGTRTRSIDNSYPRPQNRIPWDQNPPSKGCPNIFVKIIRLTCKNSHLARIISFINMFLLKSYKKWPKFYLKKIALIWILLHLIFSHCCKKLIILLH